MKDDKTKQQVDEVEELQAQFEESAVEDEVVKLREEKEEADNKYRRALADYQNLQKRTQDERIDLIRSSNRDLLLRILTVLDTLMLAHQHIQDKNLQVSINHFLDILKSEGVTRIETVGKEFDPAIMEAITTENGDENKVINEVRAGFMLHDKLLRAAQVIVGSGEQK